MSCCLYGWLSRVSRAEGTSLSRRAPVIHSPLGSSTSSSSSAAAAAVIENVSASAAAAAAAAAPISPKIMRLTDCFSAALRPLEIAFLSIDRLAARPAAESGPAPQASRRGQDASSGRPGGRAPPTAGRSVALREGGREGAGTSGGDGVETETRKGRHATFLCSCRSRRPP